MTQCSPYGSIRLELHVFTSRFAFTHQLLLWTKASYASKVFAPFCLFVCFFVCLFFRLAKDKQKRLSH